MRVYCASKTFVYLLMTPCFVASAFPASWVAAQKSAWPRLLATLRVGMKGAGRITYPCLLPLLASMPLDLLRESKMQEQLLSSLWQAWHEQKVSGAEREFLSAAADAGCVLTARLLYDSVCLLSCYLSVCLFALLLGNSERYNVNVSVCVLVYHVFVCVFVCL